ncbi:MAG: NADH-quinone oxidoreductase subunit M [Pseudomonadota bacterium]|nr:NADH-quinone oxidoreductase subunit M [Pseudomonadota bacterium]
MDYPILSFLTFMPIIGALLVMLVKDGDEETENRNARMLALWVSGITFLLSIVMLGGFDPDAGMQFVEDHPWMTNFGIRYTMGVDGISVLFVLLTTLLTPICVLVSWESITKNVRAFMACFLLLEGAVIGVFCAMDFLLFYVFWEAMLIPMFLIIGVWGGENRIYASVKFFLYTFVGSVLMLIAMMYLYFANGSSFDILTMQTLNLSETAQYWLFLAMFAAFAVKVPMWPFHTWLPDAHVQAPTAGSVILAGVLLKMGAYGFLRFSLPMFPEAVELFRPLMYALSAIAIVYAALVAFAQTDIKKMIAYSSVSHMGFVTLGIFAATPESIQGALMQMLNHGVVSAALFMLIGVIYDRMHTRDLERFGGLVNSMPVYAAVFMVFTMASVALPGTNSFVGEFLILTGAYPVAQGATVIAASGVVLGAVYMLWLYRRMVFGEIKSDEVKNQKDMTEREKLMFVPLILLVFYMGLMPNRTLEILEAPSQELAQVNTLEPVASLTLGEPTFIKEEYDSHDKAHDAHGGHH